MMKLKDFLRTIRKGTELSLIELNYDLMEFAPLGDFIYGDLNNEAFEPYLNYWVLAVRINNKNFKLIIEEA